MAPEDTTRRRFLAAAGSGSVAGLSGCISRLRANVTHDAPEQISLTVKALPADEDPASIQIARSLQENLVAVGIDASLDLTTERLLLRDVLFNHDFDVFVARHPGHRDPDELRPMLHSLYGEEAGWQNPFGLSSRALDQLVEDQHVQEGTVRRRTVETIQEELLVQQPFTPIATPQHVTATRTDLLGDAEGFADPLAFLRMTDEVETIQVALLESHVTRNRNPLAVEFRTNDRLVDLLYDPLTRRIDDEFVPWLAEEWSLESRRDRATVRLRPDLTWHDGTALTADDVAFTYRFLSDTSLGEGDSAVPAPRFRGQTSLIDEVVAVDERTVEVRFDGCSSEVCPRALTVPVLPRSQWEEQADLVQEYLTEALLDDIENPIGSGPLQFVEAAPDESVTLERFEDHFLRRTTEEPTPEGADDEESTGGTDDEEPTDGGGERRTEDDQSSGEAEASDDPLEPYRGGPPFERMEALVAANARSAIGAVGEGTVDLIASPLPMDALESARETENVHLMTELTPSYYLVGFNARRHPLSNHQFRAAVARLIDRDALAEDAFGGHATPVESPIHATDYVPERLQWDGESAAGAFPGTDGELDVEAARDLFREAGFRYDDGRLVARQ